MTQPASPAPGTSARSIHAFEWMRAIAAVAVVLLHTLLGVTANYPLEQLGYGRALVDTGLQIALTRWAVPVFLMMSGALLFDPARGFSGAKLWCYVRRMLLVLATFGLAYCLMEAAFDARATGAGVPAVVGTAVLNLLSGRSWDHMWYVYALLGLYLLTPVLRVFVAQTGRAGLRATLLVLFALTLAVPTVNNALGLELATLVWVPCPVFYYLLGHYAYTYLRLDAWTVLAGVGCLGTMLLGTALGVLKEGDYLYWLWFPELGSCFAAPYALLVFLLGLRLLDRPLAGHRLVALLARYSFGIYLVHPVFLNLAFKVAPALVPAWSPFALPPGVFELAAFAVALAGSVGCTAVLKRLPLFRSLL